MALPEAPLSLRIRERFSNLATVRRDLFPTATEDRVLIDDYERSLKLRGELTPAENESIQKAQAIRKDTRAIVYIAGPLTGVDEETKKRYCEVSGLLDSYGYVEAPDGRKIKLFFGYVPHLHGTDPIKHPNVTPKEVRAIDHLWAVVVADSHISFLYPVAHGNAIEEGWAEDHMIPTVYQNPRGNKLSRLVLGMDNIAYRNEYGEFNVGGLEQLKIFTDEYATWLKTFPEKDPREFFYLSTNVLETSVARAPLLVENGLDPNGFNPVFALDQFLIYVRNPRHPRYAQVGQLEMHDWKENGTLFVRFPDGWDTFYDDSGDVTYWLK